MMEELDSDTRWLVVDGSSISIWKDNWILDGARADIFPHGDRIAQNLSVKVPDLIYNGEWVIPNQMLSFFGTSDFPVIMSSEDKRIRRGSLSGEFSVAAAYQRIREKYPVIPWALKVW